MVGSGAEGGMQGKIEKATKVHRRREKSIDRRDITDLDLDPLLEKYPPPKRRETSEERAKHVQTRRSRPPNLNTRHPDAILSGQPSPQPAVEPAPVPSPIPNLACTVPKRPLVAIDSIDAGQELAASQRWAGLGDAAPSGRSESSSCTSSPACAPRPRPNDCS